MLTTVEQKELETLLSSLNEVAEKLFNKDTEENPNDLCGELASVVYKQRDNLLNNINNVLRNHNVSFKLENK